MSFPYRGMGDGLLRLRLQPRRRKVVRAQRAHAEAFHLGGEDVEQPGVGEGDPGGLFVEDRQGLAVELGACLPVVFCAGLADEVVEFRIAPAGLVLP